jgi:ABC-2 type transport system permease protein
VLNWEQLIVYRVNFINNLLSSTVWGIFILVSMLLLTTRVPLAFGWTRAEMLVLTGMFTTTLGFFHGLFTRNFEQLSRIINSGRLDALLMKPIDSQFLVSMRTVNYAAIPRIIVGSLFSIYFLREQPVPVTMSSLLIFFVLIACGFLLLYSLWMLVVTLTMWFTRLSNLVDLMFSITGISRYPREMYQSVPSALFLMILPLTFIMISPTKMLLQKSSYVEAVGLIMMTGLFFFLSRKFWQFALKFYTSASS